MGTSIGGVMGLEAPGRHTMCTCQVRTQCAHEPDQHCPSHVLSLLLICSATNFTSSQEFDELWNTHRKHHHYSALEMLNPLTQEHLK